MKKALFSILVLIITFIIYSLNINKKVFLLTLGDNLVSKINIDKIENINKYVDYSINDDYRVMDLINDINYNKKVIYKRKTYNIQNLLVKSNLIIVSIGMNDLIYKKHITYDYIDELLVDIEKLFKLLRKYNKDKIVFLSFYNDINNQEYIEYSNKKLEYLCKKNKIIYVDISNLDTNITNKIISLLN